MPPTHTSSPQVPEWVGEINILHGWAEITAAVFVVTTLLLIFTQIGLHLHYNESDAYRVYTIRILLMVGHCNHSHLHYNESVYTIRIFSLP